MAGMLLRGTQPFGLACLLLDNGTFSFVVFRWLAGRQIKLDSRAGGLIGGGRRKSERKTLN